jgi:hypothetical protein
MKLLSSFFCFCFIASLASCSTVKVNYEFDSSADFTVYKSYNWLPVPKRNIKYSHVSEKVKYFMSRQLESKGFKREPEEPDLMIALHGPHYGFIFYEDYLYLRDNFKPYLERRVQDITQYEDDLIVDFIDTKSKSIVYRAKVTSHVADIMPERMDESLNKAVTEILDNFSAGQVQKNSI